MPLDFMVVKSLKRARLRRGIEMHQEDKNVKEQPCLLELS
jgi:hypothetical protein